MGDTLETAKEPQTQRDTGPVCDIRAPASKVPLRDCCCGISAARAGHELTRARMGRAKRGGATNNTILERRGQWGGGADLEGGRVRS